MLGVAIVGLGFGASVHLPAWKADPRVKVVGIVSRAPESPDVIHKVSTLGVEALSWAQALSSPEIQIVSLAVPPDHQPQMIREAALAGKHLFCEKPFGSTTEVCRETLARVRESEVNHAIDLFFPEIEAWETAKQSLQTIAPLRHAHISWQVQSRAFRHNQRSWKTDVSKGGGTLANFASHSFHYLEWLFGRIESMVAQDTGGHPDGVQAGSDLLLRFKTGMTCTLNVAADAFPGTGHKVEIYGQKGSLILENNTGDLARGFSLTRQLQDAPAERLVESSKSEGDGRVELVKTLTRRLVDGIEKQDAVTPNLSDGLRVQTLLDASKLSVKENRWVKIPM